MAITGIGSNYNNVRESTYAAQRNGAAGWRELREEQEEKSNVNQQRADSAVISEEGRSALKEKMSARESVGQIGDREKLSSLHTGAYGIINDFEKIMSELGGLCFR